MEDDGTPAWVTRGSGAFSRGETKAFYGVGLANGIRNPALLRQTADNRARSELGKIFDTFSASLMKDYMASTNGEEQQVVENAIKTASSVSLKGSEIVDHYVAADGTLYALAKLSLESVAAVLKGEEMGAAKVHTEKVDVDDIYEKHAQKDEPPPPPAPVASSDAGSEEGNAPSSSGATTRSGEKPAWVDGADPNFPPRQWLCGVGFGPDRGPAENAALAALSRIFKARVASVSKDFMGAYSKTGAATLEVQTTETLTKVSTEKVLSGVEVKEIWVGGGTTYALACLDRPKTATILREQIAEADAEAGKHLDNALRQDKAGRVRELAKALDVLARRAALNGELRIVDPDGIGMQAEYSHVDVAAAFDAAVEALKIAVVAEGTDYEGDFRGAMIEGLTNKGYKVFDGASEEADVLVTATIRLEDGGSGTGRQANYKFARCVIQVEVKNVAKDTVLTSLNESRKEGHRNLEEAERRSVRKLATKIINKVAAKVESAMLR